jgi:hypothetical protein
MNADDEKRDQKTLSQRRARRLRVSGIVILLLGCIGAGWVYWLGQKAATLMDDPSMQSFNQAKHWQMGVMFGGMGSWMDDLVEDLKQPGTQAILIVVVAVILAAGCFLFARLIERESDTITGNDTLGD